MEFGYIILGLILGSFLIYIILRPKLRKIEQVNHQIIKENKENEIQFRQLLKQKEQLIKEVGDLNSSTSALKTEREMLIKEQNSIEDYIKQADIMAQNYYDSQINNVNEKFDQYAERISKKYQDLEETYKDEYRIVLQECAQQFDQSIDERRKTLEELLNKIYEAQKTVNSAIEANKRSIQIQEQEQFYKLNLSTEDLEEIKKLREVIPYLRDATPLNKVIWKCYYEKPYGDLIGRVIGQGRKTGIYKITNLTNGMCYVGQAVDIAERWRQHIKRGIGAEAPTKNKLYPAMEKYGVENFTFEVIEECLPNELNQKEDYWQDYFHAKDFGYSIK